MNAIKVAGKWIVACWPTNGTAQWFAGGALWSMVVFMTIGGCYAFSMEPGRDVPGRVALTDFTALPPPDMTSVTVPPAAPAASTATGEKNAPAPALAASFWNWLVDNLFVAAVTPILLYGLNLFRRWLSGKRLASALFETGVSAALHAYHTFVRHAKTENGGKLTEDQKAVALSLAIGAFRDHAKERGLRVGKEIAKECIPVLIERGVNWLKRDAGVERPA